MEETNLKEEHDTISNLPDEEYFKPEEGRYQIVVLSEPTNGSFTSKDGETINTSDFRISINKKLYCWSVPKRHKRNSLFSQIIRLTSANNHKATELVFDLIVQGEGKNRRYTIPQAVPKAEEENVNS